MSKIFIVTDCNKCYNWQENSCVSIYGCCRIREGKEGIIISCPPTGISPLCPLEDLDKNV